MKKMHKIACSIIVILLIILSLGGCIDRTGRDGEKEFDISNTLIEGECTGKNNRNESMVKITSVESSPKAEDVYALVQAPNGTYLNWHAFGENPGIKHPISTITTIGGQWCGKNEDITWLDNYEDHLLRADEEFYISNELVPPDADGYTFVLEYKTGKTLLEVDIEPIDPNITMPKPTEGTLEDIEFHIEIANNTLIDGEFNVSCSLKNTGKISYMISELGLEFPTFDFFIYTPDNTLVHYLGPWVDCRCMPNGFELQAGENYKWTSTIGTNYHVWGEDNQGNYMESYIFEPGEYIMYGNYTSNTEKSGDISAAAGWTHSNIINFTLEDPTSTSNEQLKCQPVVKVTGINYTSNPSSIPYQDVHEQFSGNYTGANLSSELRNLTIESILEKAKMLGENSTILFEAIKITYSDWDARPYRIPCYAEKAIYKNEWIWAIGFNRANGFEGGLGHFDLYFVSISTIESQYIQGCNSTAIMYHTGCK